MMILGICAWLSNEYEIISNKEISKEKCDIILKAKGDFTLYIFEFKYTKNNHDNLDVLASKAIKRESNLCWFSPLTKRSSNKMKGIRKWLEN